MVAHFIFNLIVLFSIISLFNVIRYSLKVKQVMEMQRENPNIKGVTIVNGKVHIIEKKPEQGSNTLLEKDEICHKSVSKEKAYCVVIDGKAHYFCSWECREAFLSKEGTTKNES